MAKSRRMSFEYKPDRSRVVSVVLVVAQGLNQRRFLWWSGGNTWIWCWRFMYMSFFRKRRTMKKLSRLAPATVVSSTTVSIQSSEKVGVRPNSCYDCGLRSDESLFVQIGPKDAKTSRAISPLSRLTRCPNSIRRYRWGFWRSVGSWCVRNRLCLNPKVVPRYIDVLFWACHVVPGDKSLLSDWVVRLTVCYDFSYTVYAEGTCECASFLLLFTKRHSSRNIWRR